MGVKLLVQPGRHARVAPAARHWGGAKEAGRQEVEDPMRVFFGGGGC